MRKIRCESSNSNKRDDDEISGRSLVNGAHLRLLLSLSRLFSLLLFIFSHKPQILLDNTSQREPIGGRSMRPIVGGEERRPEGHRSRRSRRWRRRRPKHVQLRRRHRGHVAVVDDGDRSELRRRRRRWPRRLGEARSGRTAELRNRWAQISWKFILNFDK